MEFHRAIKNLIDSAASHGNPSFLKDFHEVVITVDQLCDGLSTSEATKGIISDVLQRQPTQDLKKEMYRLFSEACTVFLEGCRSGQLTASEKEAPVDTISQ